MVSVFGSGWFVGVAPVGCFVGLVLWFVVVGTGALWCFWFLAYWRFLVVFWLGLIAVFWLGACGGWFVCGLRFGFGCFVVVVWFVIWFWVCGLLGVGLGWCAAGGFLD